MVAAVVHEGFPESGVLAGWPGDGSAVHRGHTH